MNYATRVRALAIPNFKMTTRLHFVKLRIYYNRLFLTNNPASNSSATEKFVGICIHRNHGLTARPCISHVFSFFASIVHACFVLSAKNHDILNDEMQTIIYLTLRRSTSNAHTAATGLNSGGRSRTRPTDRSHDRASCVVRLIRPVRALFSPVAFDGMHACDCLGFLADVGKLVIA